jgi:D-lactate dehydrogenase
MKIFVYSSHGFEKPFLERAAQGRHEVFFTTHGLSVHRAEMAKGCTAVIAFTTDDLSTNVLEALYQQGIRFIALRSTGYDHVDLTKAKALGIRVANVPNYSPYSVAEHSVALLLGLNRKLIRGQKLMSRNNFSLDELIGFDVHKKTVGVVGTGNIGAAFARIMNGFGCQLLGYDIRENKQLSAETSLRYTTLDEVCRQSDIVSIHCPLTPETHHMFDKRLFDIMKKGVVLINTARGGIVNTVDLLDALDNGTVSGAGLDVYENEHDIFFRNHLDNVIVDSIFDMLRNHRNVILTGHQGFLTHEALTEIAQTTFNSLNQWETGQTSPYEL